MRQFLPSFKSPFPAEPAPRGGRSSPVALTAMFTAGCVLAAALGASGLAAEAAASPGGSGAASPTLDLPWREAGLDAHQAAAHLLDRFAFGARPGDVEGLVEMGLDVWVEAQLNPGPADPSLDGRLDGFRSLALSARRASETYPPPNMVARLAEQRGVMERGDLDSLRSAMEGEEELDRQQRRRAMGQRRDLVEWAAEQGFRPQRELLEETVMHKLLRATHSDSQLTEVLVDFWFNHFNVSVTDNDCRVYIPSYERDAIRPFVLGSFRQMLEHTAKHPAMLHYLDNVRSTADGGQPTTLDVQVASFEGNRRRGRRGGGEAKPGRGRSRRSPNRGSDGLNENYARELLELHTLGVDGGYDQQDVIEVARAFTGWTAYPPGPARRQVEERVARARRFPQAGFVFDGAFIFRADVHDAGGKRVLGHPLAAGRGIEDGHEVLDILSRHPSTARHLSRKLAIRFVEDEPSQALVERLAQRFLASDGDLAEVLRGLVQSPEFWSPEARRQKIKSPFELAVSSLRALDAELEDPRALVEWIRRMGQPLYAYQAPTGYPDRATAWVNTGALLNRMNFGLQLATGRVAGVRFDLLALRQGREPESIDAALEAYLPLLLPQQEHGETVQRLAPVIHDPQLLAKIEQAAPAASAGSFDDGWDLGGDPRGKRGRRWDRRPMPVTQVDDSAVAQVVGVILGSPDFQRR